MKIFPYTLIRIAGFSFDRWNEIKFSETNRLLSEVIDLTRQKKTLKPALCDELFDFIKKNNDIKIKNLIQNVRRDIFNERLPKPTKLEEVNNLLNGTELQRKFIHYIDIENAIKDIRKSSTFDNEMSHNREILQSFMNDEYLCKGLILSSRTLLDRIEKLQLKNPRTYNAKDLQIEIGLIKYLSRMVAKTSPFSTFTTIGVLEMNSGMETPIELKDIDGLAVVTSLVKLNNHIFRSLSELLKQYRPAYLFLNIRINPTINKRNEQLVFLTNYNNIEAFQYLTNSEILEIIQQTLKRNDHKIPFNELIKELQNEVNATVEEIEKYVRELILIGLLEIDFEVSGLDSDWDIKLVSVLQPLVLQKVPLIDEVVLMLKGLRQRSISYSIANVNERIQILDNAYDEFKNVFMKIKEAAGLTNVQSEALKNKTFNDNSEAEVHTENNEDIFKHGSITNFSFRPEQMFYEDVSRNICASVNYADFDNIIGKLDSLMKELYSFRGLQEERIKMIQYFVNSYGENSEIDLLSFYEDYYRNFKKSETEFISQGINAEIENSIDKNKFTIPEVDQLQSLFLKWQSLLTQKVRDFKSDDLKSIEITKEFLMQINQLTNQSDLSTEESNSYGAFIQIFIDNNQLRAVLNTSCPGYGKMVSRLLHCFDSRFTTTLRAWNKQIPVKGEALVENTDSTYFNANIHPPLLDFEISMPGGSNNSGIKNRVNATELNVVYDKIKHELKLEHKMSKDRVYPIDLGFQGHIGRSKLFQLLDKFTKVNYIQPTPILNSINQLFPAVSENSIITHPRIIYDKLIVIQRKTWLVPLAKIPEKNTSHSDWAYFIEINQWRKDLAIPDEVFVHCNDEKSITSKQKTNGNKLSRDDYKPQYLNFTNPLLVTLFYKLLLKEPKIIKIIEMLPNSSQLISVGNSKYVTEFVPQWYNFSE